MMFNLGNLGNVGSALVAALLAAFGGCAMLGCGDNQITVNESLRLLQQGKFRGHITGTTDGRASASASTEFGFGAERSALAFDGDANFGDQTRHVETPDVETLLAQLRATASPKDYAATLTDLIQNATREVDEAGGTVSNVTQPIEGGDVEPPTGGD